MPPETLETRYRVTGMDCAGCGSKVDTAVRKLPGRHRCRGGRLFQAC